MKQDCVEAGDGLQDRTNPMTPSIPGNGAPPASKGNLHRWSNLAQTGSDPRTCTVHGQQLKGRDRVRITQGIWWLH